MSYADTGTSVRERRALARSNPLTAKRLHEVLGYDAQTGIFTWRCHRSNLVAGSKAGTVDRKGYVLIAIDWTLHRAHRLAWLYVHGRWPVDQIDHINGVPGDNRIINLRESTSAGNSRNTRFRKNNTSGFRGVYLVEGKWRAYISVLGQGQLHLGVFATPEEASAVYLAERKVRFPEQPIPRELVQATEGVKT